MCHGYLECLRIIGVTALNNVLRNQRLPLLPPPLPLPVSHLQHQLPQRQVPSPLYPQKGGACAVIMPVKATNASQEIRGVQFAEICNMDQLHVEGVFQHIFKSVQRSSTNDNWPVFGIV